MVADATGTYRIEAVAAAQGAQSRVHFGTNREGALVALKVATEQATSTKALEREARVLRALDRAGVRGVARCLAWTRVADRPAMVMPRYPQHLGEWFTRETEHPGPGSLQAILDRIADVADILGNIHQVEVANGTLVHRDIKPENIFLDDLGRVVIGDFGGALHIGGLREVALPVFGTWSWAPIDQILPGLAIPDPTWDTFPCCMMLFVAITGRRPDHHLDPRPILTPRGQALWELTRDAAHASVDTRRRHVETLRAARADTTAADLVCMTGHAALTDADRLALRHGLRHLTASADLPADVLERVLDQLWQILSRGLSPISHPSPPNRFREADELAEALRGVASLLDPPTLLPAARRDAWLDGPMGPIPDISIGDERPRSLLGSHSWRQLATGLLVGIAAVTCGILWTSCQADGERSPAPSIEQVTSSATPPDAARPDR